MSGATSEGSAWHFKEGGNTPKTGRCKICYSGLAEQIEFYRYFSGWDYRALIDFYKDEIDNLNGYNLSNHFNRHTSHDTIKLLRELKERITPEEMKEILKEADARTLKEFAKS